MRAAADPEAERRARLLGLAQDYVLRARALGCSDEAIRDAVGCAETVDG